MSKRKGKSKSKAKVKVKVTKVKPNRNIHNTLIEKPIIVKASMKKSQ